MNLRAALAHFLPPAQTAGYVAWLLATAGLQAASPPVHAAAMIREMLSARQDHRPIPYPSHTYGTMTIEEAYQVQAQLDQELVRSLGPVCGYKVAYASQAAQEQFGVNEPARGSFFQLQRLPSGSTLKTGDFLEMLLETEVAFTIGKRIDRTIQSVAELKDFVRYVHAAFDIGDFRFVTEGRKGTVQDMVASGVGAHFFVLGPGLDPAQVNVDSLTLKLTRNGELIRESPAREVLGSPWNSLLWLVNDVVRRGGALDPGQVVCTGTAAPAYRAQDPAGIAGVYEGDCAPLGRVTLEIQ